MRDCGGLLDTGETFPNAARAEAEVLHLPAFPELSQDRIDRIAEAVREVVDLLDIRRAPEPGPSVAETVSGSR
jgi:hypothetical protein